jgi:hypothetical protein
VGAAGTPLIEASANWCACSKSGLARTVWNMKNTAAAAPAPICHFSHFDRFIVSRSLVSKSRKKRASFSIPPLNQMNIKIPFEKGKEKSPARLGRSM